MCIHIRQAEPADSDAVRAICLAAFETGAEESLTRELRDGGFVAAEFVAEVGREVIGHILFSHLTITTRAGEVGALSLAPMAVRPEWQGKGAGSELVRHGLSACRAAGHRIVIVLGHPHYYPKFGFSAELARPLVSPFGGGDAWMALELVEGALAGITGSVSYAPPFGNFES